MVRPAIAPSNFPCRVSRICLGSAQLLVGPASSSFSQQMKVRDSTRATSEGSERARKELGRFSGFKRVNIPVSTMRSVRRVHSSSEPSQNSIAFGFASSATLITQSTTSFGAFFGAAASTSFSVTVIYLLPPAALDTATHSCSCLSIVRHPCYFLYREGLKVPINYYDLAHINRNFRP